MRTFRRINRLPLIVLVATATVVGYSTNLPAAPADVERCAGRRATPGPPDDGPDVIIGTDPINGGGGNDTIDGLGRDDIICSR